ncbi:response regulator [Desulfamplus magnetovallimortis]
MGAVDYITKPFQSKEVLARINRHLEIHTLKKQLEAKNRRMADQNARLENEIRERKKAQAKQKELEAVNLRLKNAESLGRMAGGIAHLFNNYLYVVTGHLELALNDLPIYSPLKNNLTEAMEAARKAADISGMMLTYLGQTKSVREPLDIVEFCRNKISSFQTLIRNGINIETVFADNEIIINANKSQMQQIINHLLINASESIVENHGAVTITVKTILASEISDVILFPINHTPVSEKYVCLNVTDTGCGISNEDIYRLFEPFYTTKFTGRGLGLPVVFGIVKSWEGMIGVKSEIGHGSSFRIFIPVFEGNAVRDSETVVRVPEASQRVKVLLVDDHKMVLDMTASMLKKLGAEVVKASSGDEAVEIFRRNKDVISCLITDLSMPGLDGWETLAEIREIQPNLPAILASGHDEAFVMSREDSVKTQAFLHKPFSMDDLKGALKKAILYDS